MAKPKSLADALREGDHRSQLETLRDRLATWMEEASPNIRPQYVAQLQNVLRELSALPSDEVSAVDELASRREARRASADAGMRAKRRGRTKPRT